MVFRPIPKRTAGQVETATYGRVMSAIDSLKDTSASWYDGTLDSINIRIGKLRTTSAAARQLLLDERDEDLTLTRKAGLQMFVSSTDELVDTLESVASEWIDPDTQDALQGLPSYRVAVAGVQSLGEQKIASHGGVTPLTKGSQLHEFLEVEPRAFVRENMHLPSSQLRVEAINFVEAKTSRVTSLTLRAQIIEEFMKRVEKATRDRSLVRSR